MDTCEVFPSATMLFSDIVDFDTICAQLKPPQVFELLNSVYTLFDFLVDQNGVYKIFNTKFKRDTQTIGKIIETVYDTFDVILQERIDLSGKIFHFTIDFRRYILDCIRRTS